MKTWEIVFVAAMLFSAPAMSQTPSEVELHRRLGRAFTGADAAWREVASVPRHESGSFSSLTWRRGETTLNVHHYPHETPDEAARRARRLVQGLSVSYRAVKGYGDQAYIVDSASILEWRLIIQKGTTVLSIGSSDTEALLRIAPRMVKEIEQAQREGVVR